MGKNTQLSAFIVSLVLLFATTIAHAAPTAYTVNSTIGAGSVTGTIVTDGTIGVLATANILDWNLVLDDGTTTQALSGPLSGNNSQVLVVGLDFTATATDLLFDFSSALNNAVIFQFPTVGAGTNYYCLNTVTSSCGGGVPSSEAVLTTSVAQTSARVGIYSIASRASSPTSVPTIGFWGLVLMSLLLGFVGTRRRIK